jgi:integral membrane protein
MNLTTKSILLLGATEGISYIALFITMPLKYIYAISTPNKIVGMLHGILFITYILVIFSYSRIAKLPFKKEIKAYIASLIPFGTFFITTNFLTDHGFKK